MFLPRGQSHLKFPHWSVLFIFCDMANQSWPDWKKVVTNKKIEKVDFSANACETLLIFLPMLVSLVLTMQCAKERWPLHFETSLFSLTCLVLSCVLSVWRQEKLQDTLMAVWHWWRGMRLWPSLETLCSSEAVEGQIFSKVPMFTPPKLCLCANCKTKDIYLLFKNNVSSI